MLTSNADPEMSEALIESALPEIYRNNSFRVLNIPVIATESQIKDRADEILGCIRLKIPIEDKGYIDFVPTPGENDVRNAVQRLHNPERRLVDELFWFWPERSQNHNPDEALNALESRDFNQAKSIWHSQARDGKGLDGIVAAHNLAVLAHAMALDMEFDHPSDELNIVDLGKKKELWQEAYKWWNSCLERNGLLVAWLEKRINELDYSDLKVESAYKLRNTVPGALIKINVLLAMRASDRNRLQQADQNIQLIKDNYKFIDKFTQRALMDTIRSIDDSIKMISKSSEAEANKNPIHGDQVALNLIDNTKTKLAIMDNLLPPKNAIREGAHDTIANSIINIQITFANRTQNWTISLNLLKKSKLIAEGQEAIQRAAREIATVANNIGGMPKPITPPLTLPPVIAELERKDRANRYGKIGGLIGALGGLALAYIMNYGWLVGLLAVFIGYKLGKWIASKAAT